VKRVKALIKSREQALLGPDDQPSSILRSGGGMSEAVKTMFGQIAERYDLLNRVLSARLDLRWRRQALHLLPGTAPRLLDLACGTFDLGLEALRLGKAQQVLGADFCLPMLQAGHDKIGGKAIAPLTADALHLPLPTACVDTVTMAYGWRNLDDPDAGLAEMARVLRPGGHVLILEFFRPVRWWPRLFYDSFGRVVLPAAGAILAGNAAAYQYLRESIRGFLSPNQAAKLLAAKGFQVQGWHAFVGGISHAVCARKR